MNKNKIIEALETALVELRKPTISFTPPKREPLSDDEILKIVAKVCLEEWGVEMEPQEFKDAGVFEISRSIEKAHGIGEYDE